MMREKRGRCDIAYSIGYSLYLRIQLGLKIQLRGEGTTLI